MNMSILHFVGFALPWVAAAIATAAAMAYNDKDKKKNSSDDE